MEVIVLLNEELVELDGYLKYPIDLSDYEEEEDYFHRHFESKSEVNAYLRGVEDFCLSEESAVIVCEDDKFETRIVGLPD